MKREEFYLTDRGSLGEIPERIGVSIDLIRLRGLKAKRYLDIGCADGRVAKKIGSILGAKEIFGVDISKELVKKAKKEGIRAKVVAVGDEPLPFENSFFDFITMFELIEHLFDPDFALEEINRVLKKGGYLLLSTPNLSYWMNRITFLFGYKPYGVDLSTKYILGEPGSIKEAKMAGHIRVFNLKALFQILRLYGFTIIETRSVPSGTKNNLLNFVDIILRNISPSFSKIVVVLAKKEKSFKKV